LLILIKKADFCSLDNQMQTVIKHFCEIYTRDFNIVCDKIKQLARAAKDYSDFIDHRRGADGG
jgi:hypothetical protein